MSAAATITAPMSASVWVMMVGVPVVIAFGQLLFKRAGEAMDGRGFDLFALATNPSFLLGSALYGAATFAWVFVLKSAPLTKAYTFMALTYVMVPLLAVVFLGETVTPRFLLGMTAILGGILIINV